ncbi:hypothetical protein IPF89_01490 [Candidatus Saccharibacteria bacterium]|uniref:hypothetical protein n=1 Tax=Candidatus Saccharimonas aalborgensis TaxID=1332188 RepID=UPI00039C8375|nr:hypothetical protein [Candidatus Saccharimonas aalborgensis]QQR51489.1 MAG: hypothetical protein IPF89_01490 [Candidatus Saccharibacteria bacterium]QQS68222.1 MAG: hypothetical protein IPP24_04410 [Candidatus Saccharibacteria bacterium]QQS70545.1 MAG: hypothetical protein IPP92_04415 [Candidatus Saccharibacteria bacterium]
MKSRVTGMVLGLVVLTACGASSTAAADTQPNMNPRTGWVVVREDRQVGVSKVCDGSTLIYHAFAYNGNGGLAVIANSPECS